MYQPVESLTPQQVEELHALYQNEWWSKGRRPEDVEEMLRHTDFVFGFCTEGGQLVAFARVLTDGVYRAFIFDVIVSPQHRGHGLGAGLIKQILSHPVIKNVEYVQLTCRPNMVPFYEKFDFAESEQVYMLRRQIEE